MDVHRNHSISRSSIASDVGWMHWLFLNKCSDMNLMYLVLFMTSRNMDVSLLVRITNFCCAGRLRNANQATTQKLTRLFGAVFIQILGYFFGYIFFLSHTTNSVVSPVHLTCQLFPSPSSISSCFASSVVVRSRSNLSPFT